MPRAVAARALCSRPFTQRSGMTVFLTRNVSIYYGSFRAVTDVSLPVYENQITAFIGSSGSGKTDTRTGVLIEHGPTAQIFEDPHDPRTQAYVTGRIG